jgi:ABC-type lipoprotein export system ATPase subunit
MISGEAAMSELKLESISYCYRNGELDALSDISCVFEGGALCAVMGPSGSGKTTLLSILAGMDRPGAGSVLIDGKDLATLDLDRYRRERVAMIFQAFQLFPLLTALENASFPAEMNGMPKAAARKRAKELLESVGIGKELWNRFPSHLSGGEQQRVAIARALSSGAKVLLADEPTGNLDSVNGTRVMEILRQLAHKEGYCVIVVTHDQAIADEADRVLRLRDGFIEVP